MIEDKMDKYLLTESSKISLTIEMNKNLYNRLKKELGIRKLIGDYYPDEKLADRLLLMYVTGVERKMDKVNMKDV